MVKGVPKDLTSFIQVGMRLFCGNTRNEKTGIIQAFFEQACCLDKPQLMM
ncbi:MAG: hypothetical protein ABFD53_01760 [Anaerolineaceae bacterium]